MAEGAGTVRIASRHRTKLAASSCINMSRAIRAPAGRGCDRPPGSSGVRAISCELRWGRRRVGGRAGRSGRCLSPRSALRPGSPFPECRVALIRASTERGIAGGRYLVERPLRLSGTACGEHRRSVADGGNQERANAPQAPGEWTARPDLIPARSRPSSMGRRGGRLRRTVRRLESCPRLRTVRAAQPPTRSRETHDQA
jgi:hypothetical protein